MKPLLQHCSIYSLCATVCLVTASVARGQGDDRLVGIWFADQGYKTVELLFRSDGVYQVDTSGMGYHLTDRGRYTVDGQSLTMTSYNYFQQPVPDIYQFELSGDSLSLTGFGSDLSDEYQLESGSREDVLAREQANPALVRRWLLHFEITGEDDEFLFRPGGYYELKITHKNPIFVEFNRGRYDLAGNWLTIKPYSGGTDQYQVDIFGTTLTLIETNSYQGWFTTYEEVPDSYAEVTNKAAVAQAFLSNPNWQAGVWQMQDGDNTIDLLLRPDGIYSATNTTAVLRRVWRGRYTLVGDQIQLVPFIGQEWFVLNDDHFGMEAKTFTLDYYDSQLKVIDIKPFVQSVLLAQEFPGSQADVLATASQAQAERAREGWYFGIWATEPGAWMEFTFRPDNRYIAKAGAQGVPSQVERGQYLVAPAKITLAPYPANGPARGFDFDLYAGDLFLIGDSQRLVQLRKLPGSETGVIDKALNPAALKGERGSILGRWTANRIGESVELVFRQDGQFRFQRCTNQVTSFDYGLYTVDMASRTLVYDSRFAPVQTRRLDFYGDTMTIYGGLSNTPPSTYTVNLGTVDAAIAASLAADAQEAQVDAQWLARVPIAPRDPNAVQPPLEGVPTDPRPGNIFPDPTVFTGFEYYRRLIPRLLFWPEGQMLGVIDTHQWYFFPTGRVLVRFTYHHAGWPPGIFYVDTTDVWGAYEIGPKPTQTDILHFYADNSLDLVTDLGEQLNMTLEDGRRNLFWEKEPQTLGQWALEQVPIACQLFGNPDSSLINTGVSLSTDIAPDPIGEAGRFPIVIAGPVAGSLTISGTTDLARSLVLESAASLAPPITWQPLQSNSVPAGPFNFTISGATNAAGFFRVRSQ